MKPLLNVKVFLAAIWGDHSQRTVAAAWLNGRPVAVCPISELGFLRTSTSKKVITAAMRDALKTLEMSLDEGIQHSPVVLSN